MQSPWKIYAQQAVRRNNAYFAFVSAPRSITLKRKSHARRELHSMKILSARVYFQSDNSREHILFGLVFQLFLAARGKKQRLFSPTQICDFLGEAVKESRSFSFSSVATSLKTLLVWNELAKNNKDVIFFAQRRRREDVKSGKLYYHYFSLSRSACKGQLLFFF